MSVLVEVTIVSKPFLSHIFLPSLTFVSHWTAKDHTCFYFRTCLPHFSWSPCF